jgi:hypothetical protein
VTEFLQKLQKLGDITPYKEEEQGDGDAQGRADGRVQPIRARAKEIDEADDEYEKW